MTPFSALAVALPLLVAVGTAPRAAGSQNARREDPAGTNSAGTNPAGTAVSGRVIDREG